MFKYTNLPKKISKKEYAKQLDEFVKFLANYDEVVSIYSIWELELYWVSDIDLLIIVKWKLLEKEIKKLAKDFTLIDTILFSDIKDRKKINYISHHIKYELVYWKNLKFTFDKENKNLNIIYAWKVCFVWLLRNFYYYRLNKKISVKSLLSHINDIRYPIFFLKNLWIEKKKYNDFLKEFSKYRKNYFEHKEYERLEKILDDAIDISWSIVWDLRKFLPENKITSFRYWRFPSIYMHLSSIKKHKEATEKQLKISGKSSRFLSLPTWFNIINWSNDMKKDLDQILKVNPKFLDFSLKWFFINIALFFKKIFDFITIRVLWKKS